MQIHFTLSIIGFPLYMVQLPGTNWAR